MRKVLEKRFRVVGLDGKKSRWEMERNFFIAIYRFLAFFSGLYGLTESWFFRFGLKDLFPLHTSEIKVDFNRSK